MEQNGCKQFFRTAPQPLPDAAPLSHNPATIAKPLPIKLTLEFHNMTRNGSFKQRKNLRASNLLPNSVLGQNSRLICKCQLNFEAKNRTKALGKLDALNGRQRSGLRESGSASATEYPFISNLNISLVSGDWSANKISGKISFNFFMRLHRLLKRKKSILTETASKL